MSRHELTSPLVRRPQLCSGQVYYTLLAEREKRGLQSVVAISRIEQLSPLPYDLITPHLDRYPNAGESGRFRRYFRVFRRR